MLKWSCTYKHDQRKQMTSEIATPATENLANGETATQSLVNEVKRLKEKGLTKDSFLKLLSGLTDDQIRQFRHAEAVWNGRAAPLLHEVEALKGAHGF